MKVELKEIVDQISEAIGLNNNQKVCALVDEKDEDKIIGWNIVNVAEDGKITPVSISYYKTLKELIQKHLSKNDC